MCLCVRTLKVSNHMEISYFVCRLIIASPVYGRQTVAERGVVTSRDPFEIFSPQISLERLLAIDFKFCTLVNHLK